MQIIFENNVTYTNDVVREYTKATMNKFIKIPLLVMVSLLLIFAVIDIIVNMIPLFIINLLFAELLFAILRRFYKVIASREYKQSILINGGTCLNEKISFTDERIELISSNKAETFIEYDMVSKIFETKTLVILTVKPRVYIILDKNGFTVGKIESFKNFIHEKCANVR